MSQDRIDDPTAKLWEMIKDIRVAMLTTRADDGTLHSRPMATQEADYEGELWFFTRADSLKVHETEHRHEVNLSYADPSRHRYVSVSGTAELVRDHRKMEALWGPAYQAWFPQGLDDPQLALLRVRPTEAEFWDSPSGAVVRLVGVVKALVTGRPAAAGDHKKVHLPA